MDEAKRKELEELRKQIDPEVLKRVAEAMGGSDAAGVAGATSGGGGGGGSSDAGTKAPSRPSSASSGSLADLKKRIQRRERELDAEAKQAPETKPVVFIVFDPSHFRAKSLGGYLNRMQFSHVQLCSDPQEFIRVLVNSANDGNVERIALAVNAEMHPGLAALLQTPEMKAVMEKLPKLADAPTFAVLEEKSDQGAPEGLDAQFVITQRTSPEFNKKRIMKVLGIE
jgi:hypothetical protein